MAEIIPVSGTHKWPKTSALCAALLCLGAVPPLLRRLKVSEVILTNTVISVFIAFTLVLVFGYPANLSLWALSFIVIAFAVLFLDEWLLVYTESIYLVANIVNGFLNIPYMQQNISQVLVQRIPLILCYSIVAFMICRKYRIVFVENLTAMRNTRIEIAERKRAEEEARKSKNYLNVVINSVSSMLISVNTEGEVIQYNRAAEREMAERGGAPGSGRVWDILPFLKSYEKDLREVVRRNEAKAFYREPVLDDKKRFMDIFFYPLIEDGFKGAVVRLDDVTEIVTKDERLSQIQKMDTARVLAGGLAHEFNNVLAAIVGNVSLLKYEMDHQRLDVNELRDGIATIENSANRAADLIKTLLTLSRNQKLSFETIDLNRVLESVIKICRGTIDKSVEIQASYYVEPALANADFTQMEEVILNLCINAWHAMTFMRGEREKQGGTLQVSLERQRGDEKFRAAHPHARLDYYWKLCVRDTGVGMDGETIARAFDPFFTTKETSKGSGIGLSVAYNIVQLHQGFFEVHSTQGVGSEFIVYLPCSEADAEASKPQETGISEGSGVILLVDDEEAVLRIASRILKECGYIVVTASDGEAALAIFKQKHAGIDLVLLDMSMPKMSGYEVFNEMKEIEPNVRVLIESGFGHDRRIERALAEGALDVIQKPFTMSTLSEKVREILKK